MEQRVMLIAGGTGSIGSVIAAQALDAGWRVAPHGRTQASVAAASTALEPPAPSAWTVPLTFLTLLQTPAVRVRR
jgi:NAD(P)-dependent dehydrogenase (short-subunit alcohol dehydrogenase family)